MAHRLCMVVVVVAWVVRWTVGQSEPYCDFTPNHTLCKFSGVGSKCGLQMQKRGVDAQEAAKIVALHNQLRSQVAEGNERLGAPGPQPKASNMRLMEWDNELALVAQGHADQCVFKHDCADCRRVSRFGVGQNLFISFQSNFDTTIQWERAIRAWYDEVADFSNKNIKPFVFSSGVGHYTQMLWWSTYKIGCGFTMYKEGMWWKKLYTCNYGPAGNIIFSEMYRKGSPCSSCPDGTTCSLKYPGLCQSVESNSVGSGRRTTTPLPNNDDSSEEDNAILNPLDDDNNNGFNAFNGFIDLNNINPSDVDLDALIRFFNSRRRGANTRTSLPVVVNTVFSRKVVRPPLITARPRTTPASTTTTSTAQSRLPPTTTTPAPPSTTTTSTTIMPTTTPNTTTTTTTTTTSPSTTTTSSPQGSTFRPSFTTNQVLTRQPSTFSRGKTMEPITAGPQLQQQQPDADTAFIPFTGAQPTMNDLMPFLRRAGVNTQVIRTSSLANVKNIIDSLPLGHKPIVLFRSGSGLLTELNAQTLLPLRRSARSTTTRGPGRLTYPPLLSCDLDLSPCEITPIGGNWTLEESESEGQYMTAALEEGEGAQVVVQELIDAPKSEAVCVALSHRRAFITLDHTMNATIPPLQVGVMPLGEAMALHPVLGAPGVLEMSRTTFHDIRKPFLLALTVGPASAPATVDLDALVVTDGECCLSGKC